MFNATIFKNEVKRNWKLWAVLTGMLCFFAIMMGLMGYINPDFHLPGTPSIEGVKTELIDIYAGAFYVMMGLILIIVYICLTGNKLVASEVDKGELSYTLNTPITRKEIVITKAVFHVISIFAMILMLSIIGSAFNEILSPGSLDHLKFWEINSVLFVYAFAIGGISFFSSCWFNKVGHSLTLGLGLPIVFFLLSTIAGFGSELEFFKYLSLNTLFDPSAIVKGDNMTVNIVSLFAIGISLYSIGIVRFIKKDLPL